MKALYSILFFICLALIGCSGGGSSGSGGLRLQGVIVDQNNVPQPYVTVTVLLDGQTATTDNAGRFEISTDNLAGDLPIELETNTFHDTLAISVEGSTTIIQIQIVINDDTDEAFIKSLIQKDVETENPPSHTPTPQPFPSPSPTATHSAHVDPTPIATPQQTPTYTSETPTPTATSTPQGNGNGGGNGNGNNGNGNGNGGGNGNGNNGNGNGNGGGNGNGNNGNGNGNGGGNGNGNNGNGNGNGGGGGGHGH